MNIIVHVFGTLRKTRLRFPRKCNQTMQDLKGPHVFGFSGNHLTIVSYAPSSSKAVVLLSTMHHTATTARRR